MKDIVKLLKLDVVSMRPYITMKNLLISLGLGLYFGATLNPVVTMTMMPTFFASLFGSYPFVIGDEAGIDSLYRILGIKESKVVLGRYIFALIVITIALLIASAMFWPLVIFNQEKISFLNWVSTAFGGMLGAYFIIALQYPLYFKLGYAKGRLVASFPFVIIFMLGGLMAVLKNKLYPLLKQLTMAIKANEALTVGIFLGIWMLSIGVSLGLAVKWYKRRDF